MIDTQIIDGNAIADRIYTEVSAKSNLGKLKLGVIQVGDNPGSKAFINQKHKVAEKLGIGFELKKLPENSSKKEIISQIEDFNDRGNITGFIVQLPLPGSINEKEILKAIDKKKDVDGLQDLPNSAPCVAQAVREIIKTTGYEVLGKMATVVGDTFDVGKPIGKVLMDMGAQVMFLNDQSKNAEAMCKMADILISATGVAHLIDKDKVKEGAFVIDVGFSRLDGKVVGDVNTEEIKGIASYISPVPGGVGPVNVACLFRNLVSS